MGYANVDILKANSIIGPQPGLTTGQVYYVNSGTGALALVELVALTEILENLRLNHLPP